MGTIEIRKWVETRESARTCPRCDGEELQIDKGENRRGGPFGGRNDSGEFVGDIVKGTVFVKCKKCGFKGPEVEFSCCCDRPRSEGSALRQWNELETMDRFERASKPELEEMCRSYFREVEPEKEPK